MTPNLYLPPIMCALCGKRFKTWDALGNHMALHGKHATTRTPSRLDKHPPPVEPPDPARRP